MSLSDKDFEVFCEETGREYRSYANTHLFIKFAEWVRDKKEDQWKAALERIRAVACGEEQVDSYEGEPLLEGDTGGMQWIYKFALAELRALAGSSGKQSEVRDES